MTLAPAENTHCWGKDHCTSGSGLQLSNTGLDRQRKYVVFARSEAVESKLVKLEVSRTVALPQR